MRMHLLIYLLIVLGGGLGIYFTLQAGKHMGPPVAAAAPAPAASGNVLRLPRENLREPLSLLLVQLILIIVLARVFGGLMTRLGQPAVIGEMIAGIMLGPSLVGTLFPGAFQFIFPASSLGALRMLSQVGVILFMFVVGMELDPKQLRGKACAAVMVSHASIVFPYMLGVILSFFLYSAYATPTAGFPAFALFMGIAMSITAFPVLARILEERGLTRTHLGITAITCAAVDDVTAWTILAFVVAMAKAGSPGSALPTIVLLLAFVGVMVFGLKPLLKRWLENGRDASAEAAPTRGVTVAILILVFTSGLFTEVIGVHALFGAFLAGVILPDNAKFRLHLRERLESFSSAFLLPLFFAFTGLRTQVGLLNDWESLAVCLGIIFIATLGKLGGSMVVARWTGMNWNDAFALGALMNTRGLVELIVLNIGFDLGILSPRAFTMMVMMALVTTCMTGPLLSLANALRRKSPALAESAA